MKWKVHIAKKKEGDGYKNLKNALVSWGKIILFLRKQVTPLQGDHKTNLDLQYRVMGLL